MESVLKGTFRLFLFFCLCFIQCSKTLDTPFTPKSSAKTLINPTVDGLTQASSTFDAATVTVPAGTNVTALKLSFTLPINATAKPASGLVQNFKGSAEYEKAIGRAALHLQAWYKEKTGGSTFRLNNPIVEVYKGKQSSKWYSETKNRDDPNYYYWYNKYVQ